MLKIINEGARSDLPFSPAIVAGDLMFVSGQASVDTKTGAIITGTFEEEMRRSIRNLAAILEAGGSSLDHVISVKAYVAQQGDLAQFNAVYPDYFSTPFPTRSTIVGVLGTMLKFEIDCVAYLPKKRQEASL